jgi:uncharacterized protein YbjT (DUF2867 family)
VEAVRSFAELAVRGGATRLALLSGRGEPEAERAEQAVAALTDDRHVGQLYELTGARSLTMAEAAAEIAQASGRQVRYVPVSLAEHAAEAAAHGVPPEVVELLTYLFREANVPATTPWRRPSRGGLLTLALRMGDARECRSVDPAARRSSRW